jgi:hypothetical protein
MSGDAALDSAHLSDPEAPGPAPPAEANPETGVELPDAVISPTAVVYDQDPLPGPTEAESEPRPSLSLSVSVDLDHRETESASDAEELAPAGDGATAVADGSDIYILESKRPAEEPQTPDPEQVDTGNPEGPADNAEEETLIPAERGVDIVPSDADAATDQPVEPAAEIGEEPTVDSPPAPPDDGGPAAPEPTEERSLPAQDEIEIPPEVLSMKTPPGELDEEEEPRSGDSFPPSPIKRVAYHPSDDDITPTTEGADATAAQTDPPASEATISDSPEAAKKEVVLEHFSSMWSDS